MDWRQYPRLVIAADAAGLKNINMAVWDKGSGGMGALYRSAHELIGVFCNGTTPATNNVKLGKHGRDRTNIWSYPGANKQGSSAAKLLGDHPTPKPVQLIANALLDVTKSGDLVLDPFAGSGTTIIACAETGRVARAIELDPKFVDVAVRRWNELSGEESRLSATGETFAEVAAQRSAEN
jgi:DNA modification methylase